MSKKKTIEEYKEEVKKLVGDEYIVLSDEYVNNKTKILHKHVKCGNEYYVKPNDFLYGSRCPYCCYKERKQFKKTTEQYKKEIKQLTNDEYIVLGEYVNNKTKILHKHVKCGNEYYVRPNDFLTGYRCPKCAMVESESKNIKLIKEILDNKNINYKNEVSFKNLSYKEKLRFDIYIKEKKLLLEFDGQQHFIVRGQTKFEKDMSDRIKRDWLKNLWCEERNVKLIRIPFSLSSNKIEKLIDMILNDNIDIDFITKSHIYYDDNDFVYNKLIYYSQRNSLYFSLYSNEIEEITRFYASRL